MGAEDSIKKLKRKKNVKKKREDNLDMGTSQPAQKEGNFNRANDEEKKNKKKKKKSSVDSKVDAMMLELRNMKDKTLEINGGKKKSKKLRDNKRKKGETARRQTEDFDTRHVSEVEDRSSGREIAQSELEEDKLQKSRKKKKKNVESINHVDEFNEKNDATEQINEVELAADKLQKSRKKKKKNFESITNVVEFNRKDDASEQRHGKSKKPKKLKKKRQLVTNDLSSDTLLEKREEEKRGEDVEDEVYQMSSGDEDYTKGMKKWIMQYHQSRPGLKVLQERIDDFIMAHEAKEAQARAEREAQAAEGGWTVVVHQKGRKKTTDAESGIAVGSVAQAAILENMSKKKKKEVGLDFYRFQKREAHRNEIMMLQSKFEQDKKRIQQMRAARKFRPY